MRCQTMAAMQVILGVILLVSTATGQYILGRAGVIATYGGTVNGGKPCYFPFLYNGKMYSACTLANHDKPWCSTSANYDQDKQWGNCVNIAETQVVAAKSNGGSSNCVFPFIYNGVNQTECIVRKRNRPWCATTNNFDRDQMSGECQVYKVTDIQTYGGTGEGEACAFPYLYKGVYRFDCISANYDRPWCGTTENYDAEGKWGICVSETATAGSYKGNAGGADCVIPFIYKGVERVGCILDDNPRLWCATTDNYDVDKKWGRCRLYPTEVETTDGNSFDMPCNFPFKFEGTDYWGCIVSPGRGDPWCGTQRDYDSSLAWGVCDIPGTGDTIYTIQGNAKGANCKLPFVYQGKTYYNCIIQNSDDMWCASTSNYDDDKTWGYCYSYGT